MGFLRTTLVIMPSITANVGTFALAGQSANLRVDAAAPVGHNGGRSQTNTNVLYSGDPEHPFLNVMKNAGLPIFADGSQNTVTPDLLNADGYPLATGTHFGFWWQPQIPLPSDRPGNYIVTWDGTGATSIGAGGAQLGTVTFTGSITGTTLVFSGLSGTIQPGQMVVGGTVLPYTFIMSGSGTTWTVSKSQSATGLTGANGGSNSSSGSAGAGFFACTIAAGVSVIQFKILTVGSPIITNVQIYHVDDAARVAAGETFGTEFLRRIREANFGVIRFLNWQNGNGTNETTWRTRKPVSYAAYQGSHFNTSYYAGPAAQTANVYSIPSLPGGLLHSSDGTAWTSGGPKDKDTIHVLYTNSATESGTVSLTIGGVTKNMLNPYTGPMSAAAPFYPDGGAGVTSRACATLVFDAKLNSWINHGGNDDQGNMGIGSNVPPELCVQLCKEVGAHPYFVSPVHSLDPATDYMAELAQYCKTYAAANAPWMIPRFEGPNETWNFGKDFFSTGVATNKAQANWGGTTSHLDWYGKALANLGQMCAAVYGLGNLGVTYQVLCGVHTVGPPIESNEKLDATAYVTQAAAADPAITGSFGTVTFTKQAASLTCSTICNAQYISGTDRFSINEVLKGYDYSVTNKGNTTAQTAIANAYVDTLLGASASYNLAQSKASYIAYKSWAAARGVPKMCGYEGCYSPDIMGGDAGFPEHGNWYSFPTGRTQVNPAIIQLSSTCTNHENGFTGPPYALAGNPGVVGQAVTFVATGTQFDNPGLRLVTFAGSNTAVINGTNTLRANQAVFFRSDPSDGSSMPTELVKGLGLTIMPVYSELYYVLATGLTGTTFQVSTTRGGSAVTFATGSSVGNTFIQECWRITAVDTTNHRVTLDLDSTGFTAPTGGYMPYAMSRIHTNNMRHAGKGAPNLQGYTYGGAGSNSNYQNFVDAGGEFPSNFLIAGTALPSGNVWNVLEPINTSTTPPQWAAIIAFNH